jgi:hypothetical protein
MRGRRSESTRGLRCGRVIGLRRARGGAPTAGGV